VLVPGSDELLAQQLRRPHRVRGVDRLVAAGEHDSVDAGVDGCVDDVLETDDVGLYRFERVVLTDVDVFHPGGVDDHVDVLHRARQTLSLPNVPEEIPASVVVDLGLESRETGFAVVEYPDYVRIEIEKSGNQGPTDRASTPGDQDVVSGDHLHSTS